MRLLWFLLLPPLTYQCLAVIAGLRHASKRSRRRASSSFLPAVSVLKPVRGLDPNTYSAFLSQAIQDYPQFEILFGVNDPSDSAIAEIQRLQASFPTTSISLIRSSASTPNGKVGILIDLARQARYPVWVINDSDIRVTPDYLSSVVAPLADAEIGVVTCLYRVSAHSPATTFEALGIAIDFMPSTLVAQLLGVREFGFGSTLAFRAADLLAAGGFERVADYIADDYQLARGLTANGKRALLSTYTVETSLGEASWSGVWHHQLRWARTIRVSKGLGHLGLPITHAGLWALVALGFGAFIPATLLLAVRIGSAVISARLVLGSGLATRLAWLAPVWDLYAFGVWAASYAGRRVRWRDRTLRLDAAGRIIASSEEGRKV